MGNKKKAYLLLLLNAFLWGVSPPLIKIGLQEVTPLVFLYYRHFIVAILVLVYLLITGKLKETPRIFKNPRALLVMFLLTPGVLILQFIGLNNTTSIVASIILTFSPLIASLMGAAFYNEVITKKEKIGTIIAFIGILIFVLLQNKTGVPISLTEEIFGIVLILISSVVWNIGSFAFKKIPSEDQDLVSLNSFFLSVIFFILLFLFINPTWIAPQVTTPTTTLIIIYMAIFASLVAFMAIQEANKHIEVSESSIFVYIQPIFGIPLSVWLLKESFSLILILPILLIEFGIYLNIIEKFEKS